MPPSALNVTGALIPTGFGLAEQKRALVTVTGTGVAVVDEYVAPMFAEPTAAPVARPVEFIVTLGVLSELQVAELVTFVVPPGPAPSASYVAVNCCVPPTERAADEGVIMRVGV